MIKNTTATSRRDNSNKDRRRNYKKKLEDIENETKKHKG
jgi:hypothetical protein